MSDQKTDQELFEHLLRSGQLELVFSEELEQSLNALPMTRREAQAAILSLLCEHKEGELIFKEGEHEPEV